MPWTRSGAGRARGGFILAVVIALSIIIGMLVFAYYQGFRHRDAQVRLSSDRASAHYLARACVDALKYAFHEAPDPSKLAVNVDIESGTLLPFLLGDSASLKIRFDKKTQGKKDHREFIEQLVGKEALEPIDRLVARLPEGKASLFVDLKPEEMWPTATPTALKDPAYKVVRATYRVVAQVRKAQESYRTTDVIDVHSLLPPAVSKFTFSLTGNRPMLNSHKVTTSGQDAGGTAPVVLMHHPDDGDPVTENPFEARPTAQKNLTSAVKTPEEIITATADRGMVYLPGTDNEPTILQLGAGGTPFGEYHSVYQPVSGKVAFPTAANLPEQPPRVKGFKALEPPLPNAPPEPPLQQVCTVQGAVFGFFDEFNQEQLLGNPPPGVVPEMCSQLKPFGTGTHPSAGAVVGHVHRAMAAVSDIAIDRDDTSRDESDQQAAVGKALPVRDAKEPFLRSASESEFDGDVASETANRPPARLTPFGLAVPNANALADLNGDGQEETPVASEALHNPIRLDPARWRYGALFDNYEEYRRVMSKYLVFPANLSLSLGSMPLERSRETLLEVGFGKTAAAFRDWVLADLKLESRDVLHQAMAQRGASKYYIDTQQGGLPSLQEAIVSGARARYPAEVTYLVKGQRRFEEIFMPGGQIDLQGLKVMVIPEKPEDKPPLEFEGDVVVKPGSGGTLIVAKFKARSLKNPGTVPGYAPFVLQAQMLVLAGKGPFEGIIVPGEIMQEKVNDYSVIRGSLTMPSMPGNLAAPLVVTYDPRNDPTSKDALLYYRAAFRHDSRVYDLEDRQ